MSAVEDILAVLNELDAGVFTGTLPVDVHGKPTRLPAVVIKQVGGGGVYAHEDGEAAENPLWEFRCWADSYAGTRTLALEVKGAIAPLGMQVSSHVDDIEPQTGTRNAVLTASGHFPTEVSP